MSDEERRCMKRHYLCGLNSATYSSRISRYTAKQLVMLTLKDVQVLRQRQRGRRLPTSAFNVGERKTLHPDSVQKPALLRLTCFYICRTSVTLEREGHQMCSVSWKGLARRIRPKSGGVHGRSIQTVQYLYKGKGSRRELLALDKNRTKWRGR